MDSSLDKTRIISQIFIFRYAPDQVESDMQMISFFVFSVFGSYNFPIQEFLQAQVNFFGSSFFLARVI